MFQRSRLLPLSIIALAVTGCSSGEVNVAETAGIHASENGRGGVSRDSTSLLFVAGEFGTIGSGVLIYNLSDLKNPVGSVVVGTPGGVVVDSHGDFYVAQTQGNQVVVFHQGQTSPYRIITGLTAPVSIAVDSGGNVYSNQQESATIDVTSPGSDTPTATLTAHALFVNALAVDAVGNLFAGGDTEIDEFPAGSTSPRVLGTSFNFPEALAVDSEDNLIVAQDFKVDVFAPPYSSKPISSRKIKAVSLALSPAGDDLWTLTGAGCRFCAKRSEHTYPALTPVKGSVINYSQTKPTGLAIFPAPR